MPPPPPPCTDSVNFRHFDDWTLADIGCENLLTVEPRRYQYFTDDYITNLTASEACPVATQSGCVRTYDDCCTLERPCVTSWLSSNACRRLFCPMQGTTRASTAALASTILAPSLALVLLVSAERHAPPLRRSTANARARTTRASNQQAERIAWACPQQVAAKLTSPWVASTPLMPAQIGARADAPSPTMTAVCSAINTCPALSPAHSSSCS